MGVGLFVVLVGGGAFLGGMGWEEGGGEEVLVGRGFLGRAFTEGTTAWPSVIVCVSGFASVSVMFE